jgi:hypothetical protein
MHIPRIPVTRRAVLRGFLGSVVVLPWMESMQARAASARIPQRAVLGYLPMGMLREEFFPGEQKREESAYQSPFAHLSSRTLRPLEKVGSKVTLVTELDRLWKDSSDQHEQCGSCFLSSVDPRKKFQSRMPQGRTLDHILAEKLAGETPFRTLEFSCNPHHDNKESIHFESISWFGPEHCASPMREPREVYKRLFRIPEKQPDSRVTDLVLADAHTLSRRLGHADRHKLGEYLESVRTIERQMERLAAMRSEIEKLNLPEPPESHVPRGEFIRLMGDLMIAALQSGLTRVATFMVAPERWETPYLFEGISDKPLGHHGLSHGGWSESLRKIDEFHVSQFAYMAERMDAIREADGTTLLDNTMFTFGSGLGHGLSHSYKKLPIIVMGSGGRKLKTGFQLTCKAGTALADLWLTQLRAVGGEQESFADSSGVLSDLLV